MSAPLSPVPPPEQRIAPLRPGPGAKERRPRGLFLLNRENLEIIYAPREREEIGRLVDLAGQAVDPALWRDHLDLLREAEVIFSGWGAPLMDRELLDAAPCLRAVFYGAGSIRYFTPPAFWERGLLVTSANAANALPVAEYTLAVIVLSLKQFWSLSSRVRTEGGWEGDHRRVVPGTFRSTVGLVSFGAIARRVVDLLRHFDTQVLVHCPFLEEDEARELGVELCGLEELFERADVVSIHTPLLPETRGMIGESLVARMKDGASLINTSRGDVLDEASVIRVLSRRPDLFAILDVCSGEPRPDPRLLRLPNVILTPHIAGSLGPECHRLGSYMVEELRRYLAGEPLRWRVTREMAEKMA